VTPQHDFWKLLSMETPDEVTWWLKPSPDRFMAHHLLKYRPLRNCKNGKSVAHFAMQACATRMDM
jgi:hypothetical protein